MGWCVSVRLGGPSLRDRIRQAGSKEEVLALLELGESFKNARAGNRRKWKAAGDKRLSELEQSAPSTPGA